MDFKTKDTTMHHSEVNLYPTPYDDAGERQLKS